MVCTISSSRTRITECSIFTRQEVNASRVRLLTYRRIFCRLSRVRTRPELGTRACTRNCAMRNIKGRNLTAMLRHIEDVDGFRVSGPMVIDALKLLISSKVRRLIVRHAFLIYVIRVGRVKYMLKSTLINLSVKSGLVVLVRQFNASMVVTSLSNISPCVRRRRRSSTCRRHAPSSYRRF